ncbi:MAG: imidazolonepropionase [Muribaculaceae bacterium]|nr:imidazolonepropionase [Muribaculaceae bacterium]
MLIKNISLLAGLNPDGKTRRRGSEMSELPSLADAWLRIAPDGTVDSYGQADTLPAAAEAEETIDAAGGIVIPAFCDSHSHIVYAGSRHGEFVDKIHGLSYEQIAANGGGILNSADRLHQTSEDELFAQSLERAREVMLKGTGCLEIKSGYGLTLPDELKMLRVIARIAEALPVTVRATFLGAHAVGRAYAGRQADYVRHIIDDMLPAVAAEGLADFVDVFCDRGFFTTEETERIMEAAATLGLRPKIHANELDFSGGVQAGVRHKALSVDHLERIGDEEIAALSDSDTVATMLPGASFFLGMPYAPARRALDAGATVALASDYNPGSSPSGDMRMVWALGCIKMKLTPEEALNAVTINGAAAMDLSRSHGSIAPGMSADLIITRPMDSLAVIPYQYTSPWISHMIVGGRQV